MKLSRILLALALVLLLAGVAYVSQRPDPPATRMAAAAQKLLDSLTPEQKKKIQFDFDSPERTKWHFIPLEENKRATRKGLPLEDMNEQQKKLALALVAAGTSDSGNKQAVTIMSLESILKKLESKGPVRNPEWYFFTLFGTPGKSGKWGWRVEGHHLSINYTLDNNDVVSATPTFFGANPADPMRVKSLDKKLDRVLPEAEDYARELFKSLTDEQRTVALQKIKQFGEPKAQSVNSGIGAPVGLAAAKMNEKQRDLLTKLVRAYIDRWPEEVAAAEWKTVQNAGMDKIHFAYTGSTEPGQGYTYRVQGPTWVIEFLNMQKDGAGNDANHIHSDFRRIEGDFGIKK